MGIKAFAQYTIYTLHKAIYQLYLKVFLIRKLYGPVGGSRVERRPARPEKVLVEIANDPS